MISTTVSQKMLSPSLHPYKSFKWMTMSLWLALVVLTFISNAQAGVIKKREIPLTTEIATTTTTAAILADSTTESVIPISDLSHVSTTRATVTASESPNSDAVSELALKSVDPKSMYLQPNNLESSREYVHNEIALNDTRKQLKTFDERENVDIKKESLENSQQQIYDVVTESSISLPRPTTNNTVQFHNEIAPIAKVNLTHSSPFNGGEPFATSEKLATIEGTPQLATASPSRDNSIETNHIMKPSVHSVVTTPVVLTSKDLLQHSRLTTANAQESATVTALSPGLIKNEKTDMITETTTMAVPSTNHYGLDRESLKDISNDLPEKTTESSLRSETLLDSNKNDRARSMYMSSSAEIMATTLPYRDEKDIETSTSVPTSHLDLKNSIDIEEYTPSPPLGEKKAKFINDNSTNAQKLNLPNNADVWSLVGMKPTTPVAHSVATETAPKHKDRTPSVQENAEDKEAANANAISSISNNMGEKVLLDWSQIMTNKELASTASYDDESINDNFKHKMDSTTLPPSTQTDTVQGMTNMPIIESMAGNFTGSESTITANSSTILSVSSFDNNFENNHKHKEPTASASLPSVTNIGDETTEIIPTATTIASSVLSATEANLDLNEINLTLNKTATTASDVGEFSQHKDEQHNAANNRDGQGNVNVDGNVHNNATTQSSLATTTYDDDSMAIRSTTTMPTTESTTAINTTVSTLTPTPTPTPMPTPTALPTADTTSSEPTITFSTHETGKVNASKSSERNSIFDESDKRQGIKSENDNKLHGPFESGNKENSEIFATATTTTANPITTYHPKFVNLDLSQSEEQQNNSTTSSSPLLSTNKFHTTEVADQNGNQIEHTKSINVEETTATATATATTTTTTQPISGSFNIISSTTIKTHLNEQVFETSTTATATATTTPVTTTPNTILTTESNKTTEKTTSSSAKDEIINGIDLQLKENNTITTPKLSTTTHSPTAITTEQVEQTAIGSSPSPLEQIAEYREHETTTTATAATKTNVTTTGTDTSETPVVALPTATTTTTQGAPTESSYPTTTVSTPTSTLFISSEENKDTTKLPTDFKFPIHSNGPANEEQKESTVEPIKDDSLETTTMMSLQPTYNATQKEEEEGISIKLLNETDNSNTTPTPPTITTPAQTSTNETEKSIYTTTTTVTSTSSSSFTPPSPPPTPTPTPTSVTTDSDASTKIDEIYKEVISTTPDIPQFTTQRTEQSPKLSSEHPLLYPITTGRTTPSTTATFTNNINEDFYTTLSSSFNEEFTTMIPPKIVTANIGGGAAAPNALPPLMGGNSGNMFPKNSEPSGETDVNVIIAITVSVIGVIALILLVAFLYLMRKRQKQTSYSQRCRPVSLDEYAIDNASVGGSMRKGSALRSSKRTYGNLAFDDPSLRHNPLGVHELAKFSIEKLRIFEEFRDIPQITAREDEVPEGCEDKNRYANVLPLPESRVVLQRLSDDFKTEYINANYVTGPKDTPNYYIACQAPLETTVEDFWRMIWEQQSRVIIQATDLIENGIEKCAEYLPPSVTLDNHSTFGDFQITLQNREVKDKYAISTILLKHNGENATRELTHYWYKWPETGVPAEEAPIIAMLLEARSSLISYAIEQANEDKEKSSNATLKSAEEGTASAVVNGATASPTDANVSVNSGTGSNGEINGNISMVPLKKTARNQGPLTIHCSPGTGRTGTIIACDIAIRSLETPKRIVDIPQIVYYVRRGRASAVLTKEQYELIYKVANVYAAKISNPTTYN